MRLIAPSLVLALLAVQIGCSCAFADTNQSQPRPSIEFVTPHSDQIISGYPITIETKVDNFYLAPPVQYWDRVEGQDRFTGHIHYTLDDCPIFASRKTKFVMQKPMGKSLPLGKHILRAELVNPNHEPLNPPAFAEINVICQRPEKNGGKSTPSTIPIDGRGREQLQKLEQQLGDMQKQVSQLKGQLQDAK